MGGAFFIAEQWLFFVNAGRSLARARPRSGLWAADKLRGCCEYLATRLQAPQAPRALQRLLASCNTLASAWHAQTRGRSPLPVVSLHGLATGNVCHNKRAAGTARARTRGSLA